MWDDQAKDEVYSSAKLPLTFPPNEAFLVNVYDVLNLLVGQLPDPLSSLSYGLLPYIIQGTGCRIRFVRTTDEQTYYIHSFCRRIHLLCFL